MGREQAWNKYYKEVRPSSFEGDMSVYYRFLEKTSLLKKDRKTFLLAGFHPEVGTAVGFYNFCRTIDKKSNLFLLDMNQQAIDIVRNREEKLSEEKVNFLQNDLQEIKLNNQVVDCTFLHNTLYFMNDNVAKNSLSELKRVTKKDGVVLVTLSQTGLPILSKFSGRLINKVPVYPRPHHNLSEMFKKHFNITWQAISDSELITFALTKKNSRYPEHIGQPHVVANNYDLWKRIKNNPSL